jgi:hypothetical protein
MTHWKIVGASIKGTFSVAAKDSTKATRSEFPIDLYEEDLEALIVHFRQFLTKRNRANIDLE